MRKTILAFLLTVITGLAVLHISADDVNAADGIVTDEATGATYTKIYEAFQNISSGDTRTLTVTGTVQAGYYSGTAAYLPANSDITIVAESSDATINGTIQCGVNTNAKLTLGDGDTDKPLTINGSIGMYSGELITKSDLVMTNKGMCLQLGYSSDDIPVKATIDGGSFTSTDEAAIVAARKMTIINSISNATVSGGYGSYDGAITCIYGAGIGSIVDTNITGSGRFGIDVARGGQVGEILGGSVTMSGFGTYKEGCGIAVRYGNEIRDTKIGTISNVAITMNTQGAASGVSLGSGIYVDYSSGGKCMIDLIDECNITVDSLYNTLGGIQIFGNPGKQSAVIGTVQNCSITSTSGASGIFIQDAQIGTLKDNVVVVNKNASSGTGDALWVRGRSDVGLIDGGSYKALGTGYNYGLIMSLWQTDGINPKIDAIKNAEFNGNTSGIYISDSRLAGASIGSITGDVENGEYKARVISRSGAALQNYSGQIGEIEGVLIKSEGTTSSSYGISNRSNFYGTSPYDPLAAVIGPISNCDISGYSGIFNEGASIDEISNSAVKSTSAGTSTYCAAIVNKDCKAASTGKSSLQGSIGPVTKSALSGTVGLTQYTQSPDDGLNRVEKVDDCDVNATYIGIYNNNGTIDEIKDTDVTVKAPADRMSLGIYNYTAKSEIGNIEGGSVTTTEGNTGYGIFNNSGSITSITGTLIDSKSRGINNQREASIGTVKNVTVNSYGQMALNISTGASVDTVYGGKYTGATDAVTLNNGTLNTITGASVFYGKSGYAINNAEEPDNNRINIEPELNEDQPMQGYARYYGSEGVAGNNHFADVDHDTYPLYGAGTSGKQKYFMSTGTTSVKGFDGVDFHYLTLNVRVRYDKNAIDATGDMKEDEYSGEWKEGLKIAANRFKRDDCTFTGWNTESDGEGASYSAGNAVDKTDLKLYAQWRRNIYKVTVTDDGNGTGKAEPSSGPNGTEVTLTATPNRGYEFREWQVVSGEVHIADRTSASTTFRIGSSDVVVKANFEKIRYTITYKLNGGEYKGSSDDINEVYDAGTEIKIHSEPVRAGYTFLYWKGSEYRAGDEYLVTEDHTFTAQWARTTPKDEPEDPDDPGQNGAGDRGKTGTGTRTGDESSVLGWMILLIAAMSAMAAVLTVNRRRRRL